jgi:AbrB family looped-hinge helix DNA binding protein
MTKAIISPKGHVAIPKAVRERLNLKAGTEVSIDVQGEVLVMKRFVPHWRTMRGMFQGEDLLKDLADDRAAEIVRDNANVQGR